MIIISQGLRQQQDVLKQTLEDNGLLLPFLETEVSGMCFHSRAPLQSFDSVLYSAIIHRALFRLAMVEFQWRPLR